MSASPLTSPLSGLARALVQAGRLKEAEAEQLISQANHEKRSLIEQILASQKISSIDLARFVAETFGYPLLDLAVFDEAHVPVNAIDRKLLAAHRVIPLNRRGNRLSVAIADPTNLRALDEIRFQTGLGVDPVVVEHQKLMPLVTKYAESAEDTLRNLTTDDINWVVPHQANMRIITSVAEYLNVPMERVMVNIEKYGNTTAATIPLCLWEYESRLKKGDNLILTAFGGGFTWGSLHLKWAY